MGIKRNRGLLGKALLLLAILFVVGVTVSGCGIRTQPRGWSGVTVADDALLVASVEGKLVAVNTSDGGRLWGASLGTSEVAIYGTPVVEGDLVYVGGYNGKVYLFSFGEDEPRRAYPFDRDLEPIVGGIVVSQGKLYFGCSDGKVYALDAAEVYKEWEFQTGDKIWSTPATDGQTIYIGSFDKKLYALDAIDGSKKWEFEAGGALVSSPLVYGNTVYIGSFDRYLYAIDAGNGNLRWRSAIEAGKWFWAEPIAYNDVIYAPNLDGKVYILDAESGQEVADAVDLGSPISSSPVVTNEQVIVASEEGKVHSVNTGNNQAKLLATVTEKEKIYAPLFASEGIVYIHTQASKHDTLYALNAETGVTLWSLSLTSE